MIKLVRSLLPIAALLIAASPALADPAGEAAVRAVEAQQESAWNAHDAQAYAALFADDADLVNVLGWRWRGRAEIERKLAGAFGFVFAESRLTIDDVDLRALSDELMLAHVAWSMTGARSPDGSGGNVPQRGIETQLLRKSGGRWLIVSFQNTNAVPERPFPIAAPPTPPAAAAAPQAPARRCLVANRAGKCVIHR